MKPNMNKMIENISITLLTEVAPLLDSEYSNKNTNMMAIILLNAAAEYDQAAEIRANENAEMRALFTAAARVVEDDEIKSRIELAAKTYDTSLRVSALDVANNELKETLIELHAYVEEVNKPWAAELMELIWRYLDESAFRRRQVFPGFPR